LNVTPSRHPLPDIDGRSLFRILLTLAGLVSLVILVGSLLYWQLSGRFFDLAETPWPLAISSLIQTLIILSAVEFGWRRRKGLDWRNLGFRPVSIKLLVLVGAAGFILAGAIEFLERLFGIKPGDLIPALIAPQGFNWLHLVVILLMVGIAAPLAEEVLFRGVLYGWFRKHLGAPLAIISNGAIFGLIHFGYPPELMVMVAIMGMLFAWSFERSRSLWVPIVLHAAQNSAVVIAIYATLYQSP
jgi:uncharacterized protein